MASTIIIVTFDDMDKAGQAYDSIHSMENENLVLLKDAEVIVKNAEGKISVKETRDVSTRRGVITGGTLGLIIGIVVGGPIVGLIAGGLLGAWTAKKIDLGISEDKIKSVTDDMKNESSALFLQIEKAEEKDWLAAVIRESGGNVVELELSEDAEVAVNEHLTDYTARH
ncbi:MAG: DUF1269 domain-containing protein [Candidatus Promineifilaceae bacterium]|nr:DUF1269 domain-containing protein [Candidatus Promineifilaceae bacterium]